MKLTIKQQKFADEYIITGNATQSAINAGYSKKTARSIGDENLTKLDIKTYIDERMKKLESEKIAEAKEVLEYLTKALRDETVEEIVVIEGLGEGVSRATTIEKKIPAKDRIKAAELLGKRYGIFTDKIAIDNAIEINITRADKNED